MLRRTAAWGRDGGADSAPGLCLAFAVRPAGSAPPEQPFGGRLGDAPVPQAEAYALAEHYPELTLRTEPAHREAFAALPAGPGDEGQRNSKNAWS